MGVLTIIEWVTVVCVFVCQGQCFCFEEGIQPGPSVVNSRCYVSIIKKKNKFKLHALSCLSSSSSSIIHLPKWFKCRSCSSSVHFVVYAIYKGCKSIRGHDHEVLGLTFFAYR